MVAAWEEQERAVAAVHARQREVAARLRDLLGEEFRGLTLGRGERGKGEQGGQSGWAVRLGGAGRGVGRGLEERGVWAGGTSMGRRPDRAGGASLPPPPVASAEDARRSEMLAAAAELQRGLAAEDEAWMLGFKGLQGLMPPLATAQLLVACFPCERGG